MCPNLVNRYPYIHLRHSTFIWQIDSFILTLVVHCREDHGGCIAEIRPEESHLALAECMVASWLLFESRADDYSMENRTQLQRLPWSMTLQERGVAVKDRTSRKESEAIGSDHV